MLQEVGLAKRVFSSIGDINIRMLCPGASPYNFNILVANNEADFAIQNLHKEFI